jgi:hypothetical protein
MQEATKQIFLLTFPHPAPGDKVIMHDNLQIICLDNNCFLHPTGKKVRLAKVNRSILLWSGVKKSKLF